VSEDTPIAVRWCGRCRRRQPTLPEWGMFAGLLVCAECCASTDSRRRYNVAEVDDVPEPSTERATQRIRIEHVDRPTPKHALHRRFGVCMDLAPIAERRRPKPE